MLYTYKNTIHHRNALFEIIQLNFSQVMNSHINSKLLDKILDEGKFSLSGGNLDAAIFGNDKFDFIIDKLMDSPPTHKTQPYAKTTMSTIFSNVTYSYTHSPCSTSTTSAHSLLNTTNPILATGHHSTSQSITPIPTPITLEVNKSSIRHILQKLRKSITITTTSTSTALQLYTSPKIIPLLKTSIQPSTATTKPQTYKFFQTNNLTIQAHAIHLLLYF